MDLGLLAQYIMNGLMVGMMYALVAVGFTQFFGVLDIIQFSHGDVLTVGAFTALMTFLGGREAGVVSLGDAAGAQDRQGSDGVGTGGSSVLDVAQGRDYEQLTKFGWHAG